MDIEDDIKKVNKYIELVIDKDYCDCNELNVICGRHCDGSKNVAYAIKNILAEREEDKKRIEELERKNRIYALEGSKIVLELHIKDNYIPKQKVLEEIDQVLEAFRKVEFNRVTTWNSLVLLKERLLGE